MREIRGEIKFAVINGRFEVGSCKFEDVAGKMEWLTRKER